ncbi:MFS transporter [Cellulomonas sp. Y8]|uniref:MFS transporter n=1 Tax=Cellulomonas sp. Y8 TaxID=2591145 RepID=UPI00143E0D53|nr:MFS transporter [Cellulomonas sp. Y8]
MRFRTLLAGQTLQWVGSSGTTIALVFALLGTQHGGVGAGLVLAARALPVTVLGLLGGVAADRLSRRDVVALTAGASALCQVAVTVVIASGLSNLAVVLVVVLVLGAAEAVGASSMYTFPVEIVEKAQLQSAQAVLRTVRNGVSVIGPGVAGVVVVAHGAAWVTAFNAVAVGASALLLLRLPRIARTESPRTSVLRDLRTGWAEFIATRWLVASVGAFSVALFSWAGAYSVLGPLHVSGRPEGAATWGLVASSLAAGYVGGALVAIRFRPRRPVVWSLLFQAATAVLPLAIVLDVPLAGLAVAAVAAGFCMEQAGVVWAASMQEFIPEDVLGRVSSYDYVASFGLVPLGYALAAPLAGSTSLPVAAGVLALAIALPTILVAATPIARAVERQVVPA